MARTAPGSCPAATSALIALSISARRPEDMPTSSGLARGRGSAARAVNEKHKVPATMTAETTCDVFMGVLSYMVESGCRKHPQECQISCKHRPPEAPTLSLICRTSARPADSSCMNLHQPARYAKRGGSFVRVICGGSFVGDGHCRPAAGRSCDWTVQSSV